MKINQLLPTAADLHIVLPDGESTGIVIKMVGQDSSAFRSAAKGIAQMLMAQEDKKLDVEALEKQNIELLAACIVNWSGLEDEEGNPLPFTKTKAIELLSMPELAFVREQIERFVAKRQNFFRRNKEVA